MSLLMERLYSNYIEDLYYDFYTCNDYEFEQKLYSGYYDDLLLDLEQREFGAKERKTKRAAGEEIKYLVESQNKAKKKILKAVKAGELTQAQADKALEAVNSSSRQVTKDHLSQIIAGLKSGNDEALNKVANSTIGDRTTKLIGRHPGAAASEGGYSFATGAGAFKLRTDAETGVVEQSGRLGRLGSTVNVGGTTTINNNVGGTQAFHNEGTMSDAQLKRVRRKQKFKNADHEFNRLEEGAELPRNIGEQKSPLKRYRKPKANKNSNWTGAISGNGGVKANTEFDKKVIEKAIEENNIAADSVKDNVKAGLTVKHENPVPKSEIVQGVVEDVKPSNLHTPTGSSQGGYGGAVKKAKENWFKKNKKALAIGGSIAAAGGLGYGIYRHNKNK